MKDSQLTGKVTPALEPLCQDALQSRHVHSIVTGVRAPARAVSSHHGFALRAVIALALPVLLSGCDQLQRVTPSQTPATNASDATPPHGNYAMTISAADGAFLFDSQTGKVWRYSAKDDAFLEVPVTSKILRYERGSDGKMHVVHPDSDPLGIR